MKKLSLQEIQNQSLEILKEFDKICRKNNFQYSLAYGTLIGAIRHNGFIPWDDDVDVWMPRTDYDKFIEFCNIQQEKLHPLKLCTRENTGNYEFYIPRFSNQEYRYINTNPYIKDIDIGIFIDIYPIDNFCNDYNSAVSLMKKEKRENQKYSIYINGKSPTNFLKTIGKMILHYYLKIIYGKKYLKIIDNRMMNILLKNTNDKNKYVGCVLWADKVVLHKREDVFNDNNTFNVIEHKFEDCSFYILKNYNQILKNSYGDYMQLPPEEDRHPYHEYKIEKRQDDE